MDLLDCNDENGFLPEDVQKRINDAKFCERPVTELSKLNLLYLIDYLSVMVANHRVTVADLKKELMTLKVKHGEVEGGTKSLVQGYININ